MSERKQLMGVIARNLPNVPSALADVILKSKWLAERDRQVAERAWDEGFGSGQAWESDVAHRVIPDVTPGENPYRKEQP